MPKETYKDFCGCSFSRFESEGSLQYIAPSNGNWGLVRILLMIPEAYVLFCIPEACGRHTALGALNKGQDDRVSYYFVSKEEITAGYDEELKTAVRELLKQVDPRPKVLFVVVGCIDDLIGTDIKGLIKQLNEEIQDVRIIDAHMNPITGDTDTPPMVTAFRQMFSLLDVSKKENGALNCVGNFEAIAKSSELYSFLEKVGYPTLRHMSDYTKFCDFQAMARSSFNVVLHPAATKAARDMYEKHRIPWDTFYVSYRPQSIEESYLKLYGALVPDGSIAFPDLSQEKAKAYRAIAHAKKALGGREIYLCQDSLLRPLDAARMLIEEGFNLTTVIMSQLMPFEEETMKWLEEHAPQLRYVQSQHYSVVRFSYRNPQAVCIGFHAAYLAGSGYVFPIMNDETMFGYDGLCRFMEGLEDAASEQRDLQELISNYGLVI